MYSRKTEGIVTGVFSSPNHGYPTYQKDEIVIGLLGIEGDAHSGSLRESFHHPGTLKANDRPISLVSKEVIDEMNQRFGLRMTEGNFNAQIGLAGLGDLGWITIGSILVFPEGGVILEITDHAQPCLKLENHNHNASLSKALISKDSPKVDNAIYSKRGILAKVLHPGRLNPGMDVVVY